MSTTGNDTKKALARFILEQVRQQRLSREEAAAYLRELGEERPQGEEPVAVIGMACRFPGADSREAFWDNLLAGREAIGPFPTDRRADLAAIDDGRTPLFQGGFLERVDQFDHDYFRIPPNLARLMDPYHRLFLETAVEALEDGGYHRGSFQGRPVGVFVGNDHTHRLFNSYLNFVREPDFNAITGSWTGVLASRIAYLFNLRGPALVVDTSCSSGLVALDCAAKALAAGDCEAALVGAANLFFAPGRGIVGEVENDRPQVRAFDRDARGTVWGEGVAVLLVKPLSRALADRDPIHGVIRGRAVNNDGTSNGLTAPSARAQQEVILKAWERAGIDPRQLSYIETHGTGTQLGDPIEIKGLLGAFGRHRVPRQFCGIGSVKTNIGHTVGVAGLASLIKVLLSLEREQLPPSLHFGQPNPHIDFCNSPLYLNDRVRDWPVGDGPRLAGVSSFSLSGTNCHLVVQEAPRVPQSETPRQEGPVLLPLSARSRPLLIETLRRYRRRLDTRPPALGDLGYTAAVGREHHPLRAALVVDDPAALERALGALLEHLERDAPLPGDDTVLLGEGGATTGSVPVPVAARTGQRAALVELGRRYVAGGTIKWPDLYSGGHWRRVHLPPQPFQRQRFWDRPPAAVAATATPAAPKETLDGATLLARVRAQPSRVKGRGTLPLQVVAWLWCEVLGYEALTPDDDFYALGGDSITGMRIVQSLGELFGLGVELSDLLGAPTLEAFTARLESRHGFATLLEEGSTPIVSPIVPLAPAPDYALSRAQQRMLLLDRLTPGTTVYNVNAVVVLDECPEIERLQQGLERIIQRHEILRSGFELREEQPVQVVHDQVPFRVEVVDLADGDDEARFQAAVGACIRPFDLARPPLLRVAVIRTPCRAWLVVDMHHIVTDGASMGVLVAEYQALAQGREPPPLPCQYRDFAAWHNDHLDSSEQQRQARFWQQRFAEGVPVLELPTDLPRPAYPDFRGARTYLTLVPELVTRVEALARQRGCTLFMVLLAAFKVLLHRLGGGDDLVVGTPVSGRSRPELQGLIGLFVNTLALRDRLEPARPFSDFLETVRVNTLAALDHQDYPYEALVEALGVERDAGRNPLFDVYFVLQNEDMGLGGEGLTTVPFDGGGAKFDLTVCARPGREGLLMEWEYATALYRPATVRAMAARYQGVLEQLCDHPEKAVQEVDLLLPDERRRLLEDWNATAGDYPGSRGIPELFREQVARNPAAPAVEMDGTVLSYGELERAANRLAHRLLGAGVTPGQPVGLLLERGPTQVVAILGVLKAGGAYVPLDLDNPPQRRRDILTDSGARLLVAGPGLEAPADWEGTVLTLDDPAASDVPDHDPQVVRDGESLAYIMFTSGSTGRPKGTLIRHKSVIRVVRDNGYLVLGPDDVGLMLSNYAFDGSVFDLFGTLLNGGRLVLVDKATVLDPQALARVIRERGVTVFFITTALFNALWDVCPEALAGVRRVLFGGEGASFDHVNRALERLGPGRLIHVYGPTETTVFATAQPLDRLDPALGAVPIGRPIANTRVYVLDQRRRLVPVGVEGELYIGGDGLALGYLDREELTARCFVDDPFRPGARLYRSGDRVKWLDDGSLLFLGRRDHQVKVRGLRIELGEVEAALQAHPQVRAALATAAGDGRGPRQLRGYVVPHRPDDFQVEELRAFLRQRLPDYMVPGLLIALAAFPLNPNGKIDRRALPDAPPSDPDSPAAPRSEAEAALAAVWQGVLGLERVALDDNFFTLGGDSIRAIQVVARLQGLGYGLEVPLLFRHQSIRALAPHLSRIAPAGDTGPVSGPLPLNPIQRWWLQGGRQAAAHFNQAMVVELPVAPDLEVLDRALEVLCRHHDALRTVFVCTEDGWQARVRTPEEGPLYRLEQASVESGDPADLAIEARLGELQTRLDLEQGPLVAAGLYRHPRGGALCLTVHHLVVDLVSWGILLEDLQSTLEALEAGREPLLPPRTASFAAWNQALLDYAADRLPQGGLPHWRALAAAPRGRICDPDLAAGTLAQGETVTRTLPAVLTTELLGEANRAYASEPQHLLLCALGRALAAWRGEGDYLVGLESHGRDGLGRIRLPRAAEVSRTVGWFTVVFPFLLAGGGEPGVALKATKEALRNLPGKGLDYGVLRYLTPDLEPEDRAALESLTPQVGFNFLGELDGTGEHIRVRPLPRRLTNAPTTPLEPALDVVAAVGEGRLKLEALVDVTRLEAAAVVDFLALWEQELAALVAHCLGREGVERTASDFTVTPLSQNELDDIFSDLELD